MEIGLACSVIEFDLHCLQLSVLVHRFLDILDAFVSLNFKNIKTYLFHFTVKTAQVQNDPEILAKFCMCVTLI